MAYGADHQHSGDKLLSLRMAMDSLREDCFQLRAKNGVIVTLSPDRACVAKFIDAVEKELAKEINEKRRLSFS